MDAVAYIRVSTDGQVGEDRFGLDAQREAVTTYAAQHDINIIRLYADEGVSGATLDRPALQALLNDSSTDTFSIVIVPKLDRLARDLYIQLFVEKELAKVGVDIVSATEPFAGTDPMTTALKQMAGVFAELEKHRIKERMTAGRKQKARMGGYAGGGVPYGYQSVPGTRALFVNPDKAASVRRTFELRRIHPDWIMEAIAVALTREGHTTATGRPISKAHVWRVLQKEAFYRGVYSYADVTAPGRHPAILDGDEARAA